MDGENKICPVCGETIKAAAIKCRFCNTDLLAHTAVREPDVERDLFTGHPAMLYNVRQIVPFLIVIALAVGLLYAMNTGYIENSSRNILYTVGGAVAALSLILLFYYAKSLGTSYRITTQRIKLERGLLSKVQESLELFRIDHFEIRKPIGSRILGQASLHLFSSDAELTNFSIYGIRRLEALADELRNCQLRERQRRSLTTFVKA